MIFAGGRVEGVETGSSNSAKILKAVMDEYWQFLLEDSIDSIYLRQKQGLEIKSLPQPTLEKAEAGIRKVRSLLQKLTEIKPNEISYDEHLTLQILAWEMGNQINGHDYFWLYIPIASYSSLVPYVNRVFTEFQFQENKHLKQYLDLLGQYPGFIEDIINHLKQQYQEKIILPKPALMLSVSYLGSLIQPAEKSAFYVPKNRLKALSQNQTEITEFQKKVSRVITSRLNPGLKKLLSFIQGDYLKQAPETVGLWQYPRGKDYYRFLVKYNTSLDLTPEEIHQIGLKEINNLRRKLDKIRREVKFKGDVDAFVHFLKTAPRFKPKSAEEIGKRMSQFKEQAEAKLPLFFSKLPKAPCGIKRLDPLLEGSMTWGYYQVPTASDPKGYYIYNGSNLASKNILTVASAALVLHELFPGHHLQVNLQSENEAFHTLRREYTLCPYNEGWAEYASQLGREMNIYQDPYEWCGRIFFDLLMSVRLVVDTGMNYLKWPRQKAKEFMKKNLLLSDIEIETETLRYSTGIPGQALGYKIGSLKIWELRKKAEKALGPKFDIRRFHDAILGSGTMPLFLLEKHVEHFIEKEKNPSARGAYMLRKSLVLVFIRLRVMARHHEELL
jgi:uncharacterized protein (DUF885 family)